MKEIGKIYGTNKILEKSKKTDKRNRIYWTCQCILCNNIRDVRDDNVFQKCRSCAAKTRAYSKKTSIIDNLTGKTFGYWFVISKSLKPNYWHCKCLHCGTEKDVFRGNLISGKSKSCGCINSWGEHSLILLFNKYKISFQKEYIFKDLLSDKQKPLRFDFAIFNKENKLFCLIEFDGRQHKEFDKNWKMSYKDFQRLQYLDKLKNIYCRRNNLKLYRLTQKTNLEFFVLKLSQNIKGIG